NLFDRAVLSSVNYERWSTTPIWNDAERCIGNLAPSQRGTLSDPIISEGGRKFLVDLLSQLSDRQLADAFSVARFDKKPHGGAPVDERVDGVKHEREEIGRGGGPGLGGGGRVSGFSAPLSGWGTR